MAVSFRTYGQEPYDVAVVHGGPGAPGEMKPIAIELSKDHGVIEPLQTATSMMGQVDELYRTLYENAKCPVTMIGHSWGAMLGFLVAATYPETVKKLVLVSSGSFIHEHGEGIKDTRMKRMSMKDRAFYAHYRDQLNNPAIVDKKIPFEKLAKYTEAVDSYDLLTQENDVIEFQSDLYCKVWREIQKFRIDKGFINLAEKIKCPVVVIHGTYDTHPFLGVDKSLAGRVNDYKSHLIENCGHYPWREKEGKEKFYSILDKVINSSSSVIL